MIDKLKAFYNSKQGKSICFFGFYLIFFIVLAFILKNRNNVVNDKTKNVDNKIEVKENVNSYDLTKIINSNFEYFYTINDNDEIKKFSGTKNNVDYLDFDNKYFLDIYNINQLIKKSKFIKNESNILSYELDNSVLNELLITDKTGTSKIDVYVKNDNSVEKIILDLKEYFNKDKYEIILEYKEGGV